MRAPRVLVVAKAPVPGRVKTRLGATIGMELAAELAAAALLDTLLAAQDAVGAAACHLALDGDLDDVPDEPYGAALRARLEHWTVTAQRGGDFATRLAHAHAEGPGPVVQVGMDTPQVTAALLHEVLLGLEDHEAVLGPAADGGWWALGLVDPARAGVLATVPMSTDDTHDLTRAALVAGGARVGSATVLVDVDTAEDAARVAAGAPGTHFARAWQASYDATGVPR